MKLSKLKQFQKENEIPTKDLIDICGVSMQQVYRWLDEGIRSWGTAERIAKKLNCKPEEIIGTYEQQY